MCRQGALSLVQRRLGKREGAVTRRRDKEGPRPDGWGLPDVASDVAAESTVAVKTT
jgi:hypothetical protein